MATYMPNVPNDSFVKISIADNLVVSRWEWVISIREWAKDNKITIVWCGEGTENTPNGSWHNSLWSISNANDRTLFCLRWA